MRRRLTTEEYGPELRYVKGERNVVADVLSRVRLVEDELSAGAFPVGDAGFPEEYPLPFKQTAYEQSRHAPL